MTGRDYILELVERVGEALATMISGRAATEARPEEDDPEWGRAAGEAAPT